MKKIISYVLICVLILPGIFAQASDAPADSSDWIHSENLLGAIDVEIKIADPAKVTKSEFLYLLMQVINLDSGSAQSSSFSDVRADAYYLSALENALGMNIVSKSEMFYPNDRVKLAEACKMAVASLGYNYLAVAGGGYPAGYINAAKSLGLLDGMSGDALLDREDVIVMMGNFLESDVNVITGIEADGELSNVYESVENVLSVYHDITATEGIVDADEITGLYEGDSKCDTGYISIDAAVYKCDTFNESIIGKKVTAYVKEAGTTDSVVYVYPNDDNRILNLSYDDITSVESDKISYFDGSKDKTAKYNAYTALICNGRAVADQSLKSVFSEGDSLTLTDNNRDGIYDVIEVASYTTIYVESVDAEKSIIIDKNNKVLYGDKDDVKVRFQKGGLPLELSEVLPGDILSVFTSLDGKAVRAVVSTASTVDGKITEYNKEAKKIYIGDVSYVYGKYFEENYLANASIGTEASFIVSDDGKIQAMTADTSDTIKYGYLIKVAPGKGLDETVRAKMLKSDGKIEVFTFAEKVKLNGTVTERANLGEKIYGSDGNGTEQIVRYMATVENEITMIDTYDGIRDTLNGSENMYDNLVMFAYPSNVYSTIGYLPQVRMFHPYYKVTESTPIFLIAGDETLSDGERYRIDASFNYINTYRWIPSDTLRAYNVTDNGLAGAIVIETDGSRGEMSLTATGGIVYSANQAISKDGEEGLALVLYVDGQYVRYFIDDENVLKGISDLATFKASGLNSGDYVRVNANINNVVSAIVKDFDIATESILFSFENHVADLSYYYGPVYTKADGMVSMHPVNILPGSDITDHASRYSFPVSGAVTVYDRATGIIYKGTTSEIIPYLADPEGCSKILVRTTDGIVMSVVLYV